MSFPKYHDYKDSGVEWLGKVPAHWEISRLKRNVRLLTEKTNNRSNTIALENIESWSGKFLPTNSEFEGDGVAFESGDILFGKLRPYLAKVLLTEWSGEAVGDFHVLRPNKGVDSKFLQYVLLTRSFIDIINGSTFGSKMPRASWDFVSGIKVIFPTEDDQIIIARFLDNETSKIDNLIAEQEQLIELLKEKRQAVISHAVTKGLDPTVKMKDSGVEWLGDVPEHWNVLKLKFIADVIASNVDKKTYEDEIPCLLCNYTDVYYNEKITDEIEFMAASASAEQFIKFQLTEGDVIITKDSESPNDIGIAAYVSKDIPGVVCGYHLSIIKSKKISGMFIKRLLDSIYVKSMFATLANGLTRYGLGQYAINNIYLPIPPDGEIESIVQFLDDQSRKIDELLENANNLIAILKERRSALISAAVTGQIDVRNAVTNLEAA